jgi:type 2 lantibiotic biosynthesis protein LanM
MKSRHLRPEPTTTLMGHRPVSHSIGAAAIPLHEVLQQCSNPADLETETSAQLQLALEKWPADLRETWVNAVAPHEPHKLKRRLRWDGLDPAMVLQLIQEPSSAAPSPDATWGWALAAIQTALQQQWQRPLEPYGSHLNRPFVDLWLPVRDLGREWLQQHLDQQQSGELVASAAIAMLADSLLDRLVAVSDQVLWSCFSEGRSPGVMLLAHLGRNGDGCGEPVREHYRSFIENQRRDGLTSLLNHYPVLGRLLGTVLQLWHEVCIELLDRIHRDRPQLEAVFSVPANATLTAIQQGLSEPHRGGRAVAVLSFSNPTTAPLSVSEVCPIPSPIRVVYKPKDMRVDAVYQAVLADLNDRSSLPPLRTLAILTAEGYGYMEHVQHQPCSDAAELKRFYRHAGRLTAVLYVLGCTDCHHENLIASGDQLVLIDTETLLEANLPDNVVNVSATSPDQAPSKLQKSLLQSVLSSGLLPQWRFIGADKIVTDVSALGITPPDKAQVQRMGWLGLNSDGMLPGRVEQPAELPTSLPVGIGASNPLAEYLDTFCEGFQQQAKTLIAARQHWLTPGSVLDSFAGLPRRILLRATLVYSIIQRQQLEPAALRSPLQQALKLEQMARSFLLADEKPGHWPVFAAELRQMQQLDIPFFTHPIDGDALELGEDLPSLKGFIETSGLAAARQRLDQLDPDALAFQLRLIRGACEARQMRATATPEPVAAADTAAGPERINTNGDADCPSPAEAARRIAEILLASAIADQGGAIEWLGMDLGADGESFSFGPVGMSLYGGSIGIACLLLQLHRAGVYIQPTADQPTLSAHSVQDAILQPIQRLLESPSADGRLRWWRDQPLGLGGCGGILLALQQIGQGELADQLITSARPHHLQKDSQLDVIGGCSGLIGALLQAKSPQALELAIAAGNHLLDQQDEHGAWGSSAREQGLLGFSHGAAGHAAALAQLHNACGDQRFRDAAAAAIAYERRHFDARHGNWPDHRSDAGGFMTSWCHGAPGIALGRACLWGTDLFDDQCAQEIAIALRTTAEMGEGKADHLCCGSMGLMTLMRLLLQGAWPVPQEVRKICRQAINVHIHKALMRCRNTVGKSTALRCFGTSEGFLILPGFFTGLSGIAMALIDTPEANTMLAQFLSAGLHLESLRSEQGTGILSA